MFYVHCKIADGGILKIVNNIVFIIFNTKMEKNEISMNIDVKLDLKDKQFELLNFGVRFFQYFHLYCLFIVIYIV